MKTKEVNRSREGYNKNNEATDEEERGERVTDKDNEANGAVDEEERGESVKLRQRQKDHWDNTRRRGKR